MSYSILVVDSDKSILKKIKREVLSTEFKVFFAENGEEALEILFKNDIHILVAEINLSKFDGVTFLKKAKSLYPGVIKIVSSEIVNENFINRMIDSNLAKAFLSKPWKENELINTIKDLIEIDKIINNEYINNIIYSSNKLPTLPAIYTEISKLIEDEKSDIEDIIDLINTDQVTAARILKVVNSSFYGIKTGAIKTAILNLGLISLKSVIISSEIFKVEGSEYIDLLWKHSCLTNIFTIFLYEYIYKKPIPDMYYSAGLLHDLGKVVLYKIFELKYEKIINFKAENPEISLSVYEKNMFNFNHGELGATMLSHWELPSSIVETTLKHHCPEEGTKQHKGILSIVHIADYYSWRQLDYKYLPELKQEAFDYLGVKQDDISELLISVLLDNAK
jgi:HD-like signal output (HDOD) protein/ActR/RegA family two-component response regulator